MGLEERKEGGEMKLAYLLPWPICFFEQLVGAQEMPAAGVGAGVTV